MIKKIISGLLAVVLAVSLVACDKEGKSKDNKSSQAELTTTTEATTTKATTTEKETTEANEPTGINGDGNFVSEYGYSLNLPDGWEKTVAPGALDALMDAEGNNFIFATTPSDASFDDVDEEYFKEAYSTLGDNVKFVSYKKVKISGNKGHRIDISNKVSDDMTAIQTQIYLDVEDTVFLFTFTDMNGSKQDVIEGIIDSISID